MTTIAGFPYCEVQFNKQGVTADPLEVAQMLQLIKENAITDLFVISHGWNNDMAEARKLYQDFFARIRQVLDAGFAGTAGRKLAVLGVLWPSKKFAEKELTASGAAGISSLVTVAAIQERLSDLKALLDDPAAGGKLDQAIALLPKLQNSPAAQKEFAELVQSSVSQAGSNSEDASEEFFRLNGSQIMERLSKPAPLAPPSGAPTGGGARLGSPMAAGAAGGATGLGDWISGVMGAALNVANFTTYYVMKERAGTVGKTGLNGLLRQIRKENPEIKLHLIGHSFGGRLVTAAADGGLPLLPINTMTLLQAAFSHNGFAHQFDKKHDGFFRAVVADQKVKGAILITYSQFDRAVGLAYPIASLLSGVDAAALGDKNDRFGGMGRNGAQFTPEAIDGKLLPVNDKYQFLAGKLYNLNSDPYIKEHSDICKNEVAFALLTAVGAS